MGNADYPNLSKFLEIQQTLSKNANASFTITKDESNVSVSGCQLPEAVTIGIGEREAPDLGNASLETLPTFSRAHEVRNSVPYLQYVQRLPAFKNFSSLSLLCEHYGIGERKLYSNFEDLKSANYAPCEFATELRRVQSERFAFRNVAKGIEHFHAGRNVEAMQLFNKALQIDVENVEALVARGALHANGSSFDMAIKDFEVALKHKPEHVNARKYLAETLVAQGKTYQLAKKGRKALDCYTRAKDILPTISIPIAKFSRSISEVSADSSKGRNNHASSPNSRGTSRDSKRRKRTSSSSSSSTNTSDDSVVYVKSHVHSNKKRRLDDSTLGPSPPAMSWHRKRESHSPEHHLPSKNRNRSFHGVRPDEKSSTHALLSKRLSVGSNASNSTAALSKAGPAHAVPPKPKLAPEEQKKLQDMEGFIQQLKRQQSREKPGEQVLNCAK